MRSLKALSAICYIILLCACTGPSVRYKNKVIENMQNHNFEASQETIKNNKKSYGKRDISLFYLDLATQQDSLQYSTNTLQNLQNAKNIQDNLFAKSISQKFSSYISNNYTEPYRLKFFEFSYLFYYTILAYLQENNLQDAIVETRAMVFYLDKLREDTGKDDPFLQYFAGQLFLMWGAYSDAKICFKNAENAYLKLADSSALMPSIPKITKGKKKGLLTIQHLNGTIPFLISQKILVAWNDFSFAIGSANGYQSVDRDVLNSALAGVYGNAISVSLPAVQEVQYMAKSSRVIVDGEVVAQTSLVSNLSDYFKQNFDEEYNKIFINSATRAAIKFLLTKEVKKQVKHKNDNVGSIVNMLLTGMFTAVENADTRSWFTLPAQIREANLLLDEGTHEITVQLLDENEKVLDEYIWKDVQINIGHHKYLYLRSAI